MKTFGLLSAALLLGTAAAARVQQIVTKGQHFFFENGTEFFIRGVAYQQDVGVDGTVAAGKGGSYVDPLADPSTCRRDIPWLVKLRTNTIRVYAVDPTQNHDACMSMLADAGIYVISDLTDPLQSINRDNPQWDYDLYNRYTSVIEMFSKYDNVIGFFAGNEVSNAPNVTAASAFVKAAVRDSKAFIRKQGFKNLGVGYATYDGPIRIELADYFACGSKRDSVDFWGYNCYSWCGDSNFQSSHYAQRTQEFQTYPVPVFFAEYGCNAVEPRTFTEIAAMYGPQMTPVWSGGIVYMYFQTGANFGLVNVKGNSVSPLPGFQQYSQQMAKAEPATTEIAQYNPTGLSTPACPTIGPNWEAAALPLPPTPNQDLCNCMYASLECVVANGVSHSSYKNLFNYICGHDKDACLGIATDAEAGHYGSYSGCESTQQLGFVMNQYYLDQNKNSQACDFNGAASLVQAASPTGNCRNLLKAAGSKGVGGHVPQPTGEPSTAQGSPGAAGASTSTGAASARAVVPSPEIAALTMSLWVGAAFVLGAGMILL